MASAFQAALDAVVAKLEAITPQQDPTVPFRRRGKEKLPASTRAPRRLFDVDFGGHGSDRPVGPSSRVATVSIGIDYPAGTVERGMETTLALDSEDIVRVLSAKNAWAGTHIIRVNASTAPARDQEKPVQGQGTGVVRLVVTAEITYRDLV